MKKTNLQRAYDALSRKKKPYTNLQNYYYGDQPLKYSAERLRDAFDSPLVRFTQNWCAVVVDSVLDRLTFKGWDVQDKKLDELVDGFYNQNNIQKLSADVHRNALVTGESFIVFDTIDADLKSFYNDSRLVQVFYNANNPEQMEFAAKWWRDEAEEKTHLNLYYPDRIEKYTANKAPSSEKSFVPDEGSPFENPYGEIPVIHFDTGYSELDNIIPIQDAINKTFSDMMVVGEFNAFRQRWAVTNADLSALKSSPKSFYQFPKGAADEEDTKIGEFNAAELDMYLNAMDKLANSIAIISRTPKHYFQSTGGNISGEALVVMESPLIKKIKQVQEIYSLAWDKCARFILRQSGQRDDDAITTIWEPIETNQPVSKAQEIREYVNMGVPLETMLRRAGWGLDEIEQMRADMLEEKRSKATETSLLLEQIRLRNQQENPE